MLRRRFDGDKETKYKFQNLIDTPFKPSIHSISSVFAVIFIIAGVLLYDGVVKLSTTVPTQLKIADEKNHPYDFIGERSQNHLKQLTSIGQKVKGSYENEVLAVDFLKREVNFIIQQANTKQQIELDHQIVSGAYWLDFKPYGMVNTYQNCQNIVVRIASEANSNHSLLINCHFDSVPSSPGGSDDGIMCTTMLEVIRVLSKSDTRPKHNVIFLFNGAEENPLQAAHGFITQHKWAKECRAVINLESCGSGEREILFQAGPGNNFLVKAYTKSAWHPAGQSCAEEIFQSNLIPSDTDFRIFRDFGHIPGMDMAFARNGYVYHTKYDDFNIIKDGTYQHVGDNLLSIVRTLSESDDLPNASLTSKDKTVYFDYIGLFFISYTEVVAMIINYIVIIVSTAISIMTLIKFKTGSNWQLIVEVLLSISTILFGWIMSILFSLVTGFILDKLNLTMSWYTRPKIIFGLYFCPTLIFSSAFLMILNYFRSGDGKMTLGTRSQIHCHTVNLIWTLFLLATTMFFIRSTYVFLLPVLFNTISFSIIYVFKLTHTRRIWIFVYMFNLIVPTLFSMYVSSLLLQLFIPITGRFGSDKNPELIVGGLSTLTCILISCAFVPLVTLLRKPLNVIVGLQLIFVITLGCISFSSYGFPYSDNPEMPTPQRYWIFHTSREFHDESGNLRRNDSGYFLLNMDRNSPNMIKNYVPETKDIRPISGDCQKEVFCGLPISSSRMAAVLKESTWIPAPPPVIHEQVHLRLMNKTDIRVGEKRYTFEVTGPDHISMYLSPKPGFKVSNWSFMDFVPSEPYTWNDRSVYFILAGYGTFMDKPYSFWVDMKSIHDWDGVAMDIVITGQYMHHEKERTTIYKDFLNKFPSWAHTVAWITSYHSWMY